MSTFVPSLSMRFRWLSLFCCIGVLLIHSITFFTVSNVSWGNLAFQHFVSNALVRFAVPCFFVIAGYWFYCSEMSAKRSYNDMMLRKLKSLVVPYLAWGGIGVVLLLPLVLLNNYIQHRSLFERTFLCKPFGVDMIDQLVGVTYPCPWGCSPLWFVRTLALIFVVSPIVSRAIVKGFLGFLIGMIVVWLGQMGHVEYLSVNISYLGWFYIGAWICKENMESMEIPRVVTVISLMGWWLSAIVIAVLRLKGFGADAHVVKGCLDILSVCAVISLWCITGRLGNPPIAADVLFFIYCFHQFPVRWFISTWYFLFGKTNLTVFCGYCLCPCFAMISCLVVSSFLKKRIPPFFKPLTGWR